MKNMTLLAAILKMAAILKQNFEWPIDQIFRTPSWAPPCEICCLYHHLHDCYIICQTNKGHPLISISVILGNSLSCSVGNVFTSTTAATPHCGPLYMCIWRYTRCCQLNDIYTGLYTILLQACETSQGNVSVIQHKASTCILEL